MNNTYVTIMAGGIGSRFWPMSRVDYPKQFLDMLGVGKTMIQLTYERLLKICPKENIYIVTNEKYRELINEQLPQLSNDQIVAEPLRRNTAPCIAYISHKIAKINPKARMIVAPSDHIVTNDDAFIAALLSGLSFIEKKDSLITLGIRPSRPDTGYGYIQFIEDIEKDGVYKVKTFTEKPTLEIAKSFLKSGDFLWNSGIFLWNVRSILRAFEKHLPEINDIFKEGIGKYNTPEEIPFIKKAYSQCTNVSIDYGVMEKANNVSVIPADFGWSDLGTWISLYEKFNKDYMGNAVSGKKVMMYDSVNCMVVAPDEKLVVLQGIQDYIIIDTDDVLIICKKSEEQIIKTITTDIKRKKLGEYL